MEQTIKMGQILSMEHNLRMQQTPKNGAKVRNGAIHKWSKVDENWSKLK